MAVPPLPAAHVHPKLCVTNARKRRWIGVQPGQGLAQTVHLRELCPVRARARRSARARRGAGASSEPPTDFKHQSARMADNTQEYFQVSGESEQPGEERATAADACLLFQADNLRNQHEHLSMLVANRAERIASNIWSGILVGFDPVEAAVQQVFMTAEKKHKGQESKREPLGTFDNYDHWCDVMKIPRGNQYRFVGRPLSCTALASKAESNERSQNRMKDQLENLALWWSIWGEAASLRFMPELLCFVFFVAVQDAKRGQSRQTAWSIQTDRQSPPTDLFGHVVLPIFQFMKVEMGRKARGKALDHCAKMNYDDVNEYFCE
eukprot:SAG31_NODE_842_length_11586_cov_9.084966_1_plen_322_part_00